MKIKTYVFVISVFFVASMVSSMRVLAAQTTPATSPSSSVSECMSKCGDPANDTYSTCLNSCLGITPAAAKNDTTKVSNVVPTVVSSGEAQQTQPVYSRFSGCRASCQSIQCYVGCLITGKSSKTASQIPMSVISKKSLFEQIKERIIFWKKPAILSGKACAIGDNNGNCKRCEDKKSYFDQITEAWYCGEKTTTKTLFGIQPILPVITLPPLKIPTLAMPTLKVPTLSVPRVSPEASPSGE